MSAWPAYRSAAAAGTCSCRNHPASRTHARVFYARTHHRNNNEYARARALSSEYVLLTLPLACAALPCLALPYLHPAYHTSLARALKVYTLVYECTLSHPYTHTLYSHLSRCDARAHAFNTQHSE